MVNAFVKECPVVRHKNEPSFALEIFRNESSPVKIKMISRFINEQKIVFLEKECGKQQFGFFSVGKRCKRTGEHTFINTEKSEFTLGAPKVVFRNTGNSQKNFGSGQTFICYGKRKIVKMNACRDASFLCIIAH